MHKHISKNIMYFCLMLSCSLLHKSNIHAQQGFTLEQAIEQALLNNYGIQILRYETDIAALQNHPGYAGMLPRLEGIITFDSEQLNSNQLYFSGEERNVENANNNTFTAGIYLNYTIFDGFKMFATKEKFNQLQQMSEVELKSEINNTIYRIKLLWYQITQLQEAITVIDYALSVTDERLNIVKLRMDAGSASQAEVLLANSDILTDKASRLNIELAITQSKTDLIQLMGLPPGTILQVEDSIIVNTILDKEIILSNALSQNPELLLAELQKQVIDLEIKEFKSYLLPTVNITAGYGYLRSTSEGGFVQSNKNYGPGAGLIVGIPLFNGFTTSRDIDIARINQQIQITYQQGITAEIETRINKAFAEYESAIALMYLEQENTNLSQEQLNIALERYRLGMMSAIDLREIQKTNLDTGYRLLEAQLNAKFSELQLHLLEGNIF